MLSMSGKCLSLFFLVLRILLTVSGAAALLYAFSFPQSLIPANPEWMYGDAALTPEDFRPWLWVVPWLFMELVSSMGGRHNVVWFCGVGMVLLAAILAWPVLEANYPELVHPTFHFEDGKLARGVLLFCGFAVASVLFRGVLLNFLFMKPDRKEDNDANYADADVLDPAHARTVREIAANPVRVSPKFRFGEADFGLVARFQMLVRRLARVRAWRWCALLLALALVCGWFFLYPRPSASEAYQRDLARMYEVRGAVARADLPAGFPVTQEADVVWLATTPAVHAAYRVMRSIADKESLANLKRAEAEKRLGLDRAVLPRGYRAQLRDESDVSLPSVDDIFDSRTRFLTVTDGRRTSVLYVRFGADDETINISEVQDAGWNARADYIRRRYGADVNSKLLN